MRIVPVALALGLAGCSPPPAPATTAPTPAPAPALERTTAVLPATLDNGAGVSDPVAVIQAYYDAIDQRAYTRAYTLWSEEGAASGQTLRQFSRGFGDTRSVHVDIGTPSDVDAGAGQRYITIPVRLMAVHDDGSTHEYTGSYVLHRTVVDGATAAEHAWRIHSATMHETGTQSSKR